MAVVRLFCFLIFIQLLRLDWSVYKVNFKNNLDLYAYGCQISFTHLIKLNEDEDDNDNYNEKEVYRSW